VCKIMRASFIGVGCFTVLGHGFVIQEVDDGSEESEAGVFAAVPG
jgi:hypothetical protein